MFSATVRFSIFLLVRPGAVAAEEHPVLIKMADEPDELLVAYLAQGQGRFGMDVRTVAEAADAVPLLPSPHVGADDGEVLEPVGDLFHALHVRLGIARKGHVIPAVEDDEESAACDQLIKAVHPFVVDIEILILGMQLDAADLLAFCAWPSISSTSSGELDGWNETSGWMLLLLISLQYSRMGNICDGFVAMFATRLAEMFARFMEALQTLKRPVGAGAVLAGVRGQGVHGLFGDLVREDVGVEVDVFHFGKSFHHGDTEARREKNDTEKNYLPQRR